MINKKEQNYFFVIGIIATLMAVCLMIPLEFIARHLGIEKGSTTAKWEIAEMILKLGICPLIAFGLCVYIIH